MLQTQKSTSKDNNATRKFMMLGNKIENKFCTNLQDVSIYWSERLNDIMFSIKINL